MYKINTKLPVATSAPFSRRSKNCFHDYMYMYMYMKISLLLKWYLCITVNNYTEIAAYAIFRSRAILLTSSICRKPV